jgi:hypothetical protein
MFQAMSLTVSGVCALLLLLVGPPSSYLLQVGSKQTVTVRVEVKDPTTAPVPGAQVELISVDNASSKAVVMDHAGSAQAELEPGEYDVIVTTQGFAPLSRHVNVNTEQGQKLGFVVQVGAGRLIVLEPPDESKFVDATIVVADQAGAALPDAQIKITPEAMVRAHKNPKTDERGELRLQLIPGTYSLFAANPPFSPAGTTIRVYPGPGQIFRVILPVAETTVTVFMVPPPPPAASASVAVVVTDLKGIPIPYAQIEARPGGRPSELWEADEHGKLNVKAFPSNYEFAVTSPAYKRWTKDIQIRDRENRMIRVLLAESGI